MSDIPRWPFIIPDKARILVLFSALLMLLSACSGAGVVATSDPDKKLAQATQLENSGRIARARQVTREAADIFAEQGDKKGLAAAYRQMAFLIRLHGEDAILASSEAGVGENQLDIDRADKSTDYFQRALVIQQELEDYALVSHLQFNIGVNYALSKRPHQACTAFDQSLAAYNSEKTRRPEHDPELPPGVTSFDDFIRQAKQEASCG